MSNKKWQREKRNLVNESSRRKRQKRFYLPNEERNRQSDQYTCTAYQNEGQRDGQSDGERVRENRGHRRSGRTSSASPPYCNESRQEVK